MTKDTINVDLAESEKFTQPILRRLATTPRPITTLSGRLLPDSVVIGRV